MLKHIKVWLAVLLLAVSVLGADVSMAAEADAGNEAALAQQQTVADIFGRPIDFENDLMMRWLAATFGTFVFEPFGVSGEQCLEAGYCLQEITVLSYAIGFTNVLSFIIGSVIISYILVGGLINTAIEGVALGKQWSSAWLPLRIAGAFSFILPVPAGGSVFSLSQLFFFWLVVQGSNAANTLHELINEKITTGTPIVAVGNAAPVAPIRNGLLAFACVHTSLVAKPSFDRYGSYSVEGASGFDTGYVQDYADVSRLLKMKEKVTINFGEDGECGSLSVDSANADGSGNKDRAVADARYAVRLSLDYALGHMDILAKDLVNPYGSAGAVLIGGASNVASIKSDGSASEKLLLDEKLNAAAGVYSAVLREYSVRMGASINAVFAQSDWASEWRDNMNAGGWAARGLSFFQVSKMQQVTFNSVNESAEVFSAPGQPQACGTFSGMFSWFNDCEDRQAQMDADMMLAQDVMRREAELPRSNDYKNAIEPSPFDIAKEPGTAISTWGGNVVRGVLSERLAGDWNVASGAEESVSGLIEMGLIGYGEGAGQTGISGDGAKIGGLGGFGNPFETTSAIGHGMHSYALTGMVAYGAIKAMKGASDGAGQTFDGSVGGAILTGVLSAMLEVGGQILMSSIMFAAANGFVLAYVLPMMPILVWIMMLIGYLLMVVEGLIGAPMAVILLATPDGQGIINSRFERALSLVVSAIMKPSFMVIGFLASIVIGYIGFAIFNTFFWNFALDAMGQSGFSGSLLAWFSVMIIYTYGCYQLCTYLVKIMHMLPSQIMEWFSGGIAREFGENQIGSSVAGGFSDMSRAVQSINGGVAKSVANAGEKIADARAAARAAKGGGPTPDIPGAGA